MKRMTLRQRRNLYNQVIDNYGIPRQTMKIMEECAELINAITKFVYKEAEIEDVVTEIADVSIMVEQAAMIFGESEVIVERERKLNRLKERLK